MNARTFRWMLLLIAGGLLGYVVVRRRQQLADALPEPLMQQAERIVIPWSALERGAEDTAAGEEEAAAAEEAEEPENGDQPRRKVSSRHRISYLGKQYGPLPESLVGQYVEIESRDDQIFVLHNGTPVANFDLQR
jgi:hypothetical protein